MQVTFSTLEIYNESIRDLLDSSGKKDKLDIRQGPEGNQVVGLTEVEVRFRLTKIAILQLYDGQLVFFR